MDTERSITIACIHGGRRNGMTAKMVQEIAKGARFGLSSAHSEWGHIQIMTAFYGLGEPEHDIPFLVDPDIQKPDDVVTYLWGEVKEAGGLILATPVRWNNMGALMMRFLEWGYFMEKDEGWPLEGMPVGYAAHGDIDGGQSAVNAMQNIMMHLKCTTPQDGHFYRIISRLTQTDSDPEYQWMLEDAQLLGLRVAEAAYRRKYIA